MFEFNSALEQPVALLLRDPSLAHPILQQSYIELVSRKSMYRRSSGGTALVGSCLFGGGAEYVV